jgi:hypothetical protein
MWSLHIHMHTATLNKNVQEESGEGSEGQEWLLHKHKDLSSNPQNPSKKLNMAIHWGYTAVAE